MRLPAKTSFTTTSFGVRARELIISGVSGFLGLALLALPLGSIFVRILLAAGIAAAGVTYAFWRIGTAREWTIEGYLASRLRYGRRGRRYLKGGPSSASSFRPAVVSTGEESVPASSSESAPAEEPPAFPTEAPELPEPLFWLPESFSPRSNGELLGTVVSALSVIAFLTWVVTEGSVGRIQGEVQVLWQTLLSR